MGYKVTGSVVFGRGWGNLLNYMQEQLDAGPRTLSKQMADTARKGTDILMKGSLFY